jgi:pimeloyl-ACP methyl ester carboxylesterase
MTGSITSDTAAVERTMHALLALGDVAPASARVPVAGAEVHYVRAGAGRPLVLIHGAGGGCANWYRLLGPLSVRFDVLAPDLPGFGLSDAVQPGAGLGGQAARILLAWLDTVVTSPCDLVGTSFGGLVAARMAQIAPQRVHRLALLDSVGLGRELPAMVRAATLPLIGAIAAAPSRGGMEWLFRNLLVSDATAIPPHHRRALLDYLIASARRGRATMAAALALFANWDGQREVLSADEMRRWQHPTCVLWGERDRFLPLSHARRACELMPGAALGLIAGAGHSPNWERPDAVLRRLLEFFDAA